MKKPFRMYFGRLLSLIFSVYLLTACMSGVGGAPGGFGLSGMTSEGGILDGGEVDSGVSIDGGTVNTGIPTESGVPEDDGALPQAVIPLPYLTSSLVSNPDGDENAVLQGDGFETGYTLVVTDTTSATEETSPSAWLKPLFQPLAKLWFSMQNTLLPEAIAEGTDTTDTNPCNDGNPAVTCVVVPEDGHITPTVLAGVKPEDTLSFAYYSEALGQTGEAVTDKPVTNVVYMAGEVNKNSLTGNNFTLTQADQSNGNLKLLSFKDGRLMPGRSSLEENYSWAKLPGEPLEIILNQNKKGLVDDTCINEMKETDECEHYIVRYENSIQTYSVDRSGKANTQKYSTLGVCNTEKGSENSNAYNFLTASQVNGMETINTSLTSFTDTKSCKPVSMKFKMTGIPGSRTARLYYLADYDLNLINSMGLTIRELYNDANKITFEAETNSSSEEENSSFKAPSSGVKTPLAFDVALLDHNETGSKKIETVAAFVYLNTNQETVLQIRTSQEDIGLPNQLSGILSQYGANDIQDILLFDLQMSSQSDDEKKESPEGIELPKTVTKFSQSIDKKKKLSLNTGNFSDNFVEDSESETNLTFDKLTTASTIATFSGRAALVTKSGIDFIRFDNSMATLSIDTEIKLKAADLETMNSSDAEENSTKKIDSLKITVTNSISLPGILDYKIYDPLQQESSPLIPQSTQPILVALANNQTAATQSDGQEECNGPCVGVIDLNTRDFISKGENSNGLPITSDPDQDGVLAVNDFLNGKTLNHEPTTLFFQNNRLQGTYLIAVGTKGLDSTILVDLGIEKEHSLMDAISVPTEFMNELKANTDFNANLPFQLQNRTDEK